ncbi:MAG: GNAT family N-acetyltransferase [Planctomycetota bacterium]
MREVREFNRLDDLNNYRAAWASLLRTTPGGSFFQSLEWIEAYWRHFGAGQKLRTLVIFQDGKPASIVPLVVRSEKTSVGTLRFLTYPLHDWGSFYGPVGGDPRAMIEAAANHVRCTPRDWDVFELRWQGNPEGAPVDATAAAFRAAAMPVYTTIHRRTAIIDLSTGWESYLASRSSAWRKGLRAAQRRLHDVRFERCRPQPDEAGASDPRWDVYDACEAVARSSWQAGATGGTTLCHETVRPFFRDAHAAAARVGAADMSLLHRDGQPLAFAYAYHWQGSLYGLRMGYDATARDGAGHVLLAELIRDSCRRGDRWIDLGVGQLDQKQRLATGQLDLFRVSYFAPGAFRAQILRTKRWWDSQRPGKAD